MPNKIGNRTAGNKLAILIFVTPSILSPNPIIKILPTDEMLEITVELKNDAKKPAPRAIAP
jgi:hypothetical protein